MVDIPDIIRRGQPFGGRQLLEALKIAGKPPVGGRGVRVEARGSADAVIAVTGNPAGRRRLVHALITTSVVRRTNAAGDPIEFDYGWFEARVNIGGDWGLKPNGRQSGDVNRRTARNYAEVANSETEVLFGIPTMGAGYTIEGIFAIPSAQPVTLVEQLEPSGETPRRFAYWFMLPNAYNLVCTP